MKLSTLEAFGLIFIIGIAIYYLMSYIDNMASAIAKDEIHKMIDNGYLVETDKHKKECKRKKSNQKS